MESREAAAGGRAMWLLNHSTLRRFEVDQLRRAGFGRVFTPKRFPYDEGNLSASVDVTLDATLDIPGDDLALLNDQDWYACADGAAWAVANRWFRVAFIGFFPRQIETVLHHFDGAVVIRVFGLARGERYSALVREHLPLSARIRLRERASRVWFGAAYPHLKDVEERFFVEHECYLPVGLYGEDRSGDWRGGDARLFFVCPRIGSTPYFRGVYERFKRDFGDLPHVIGGAQPIAVPDPAVIGYVPKHVHERNMRELRVMYYHSREPNHAHYHPFEAVRAGMPLVFMAGGMLDRLGGRHLPGRCRTEAEARRVIRRLLEGDSRLIERVRSTQRVLLDAMDADRCAEHWQRGFERIAQAAAAAPPRVRARSRRIAVIVPVGYRGGSLRGAKLIAQAIVEGSRNAGAAADVVLGHLDDPAVYTEAEFRDLPAGVARRPFRWKTLARDEAQRALAYAGVDASLAAPTYAVPDDGATHFDDCDLWLVVSDRLSVPLLPVKPYVMMVYDYLQRYESFLDAPTNIAFLNAQHAAERVFVTTDFTYADARDFAGLPPGKLRRVPMLVPRFDGRAPTGDRVPEAGERPYFVWTTNLALHKNHANAARALAMYYEELDGRWTCKVTGVDSDRIVGSELPHLKPVQEVRSKSRRFRRNVDFMGELPDAAYRGLLAGAQFLWHAGRVDNGTFSVVEAAHFGVPSLSSDYPAMREIAAANALAIAWMDPQDPERMARELKAMEERAALLRASVPDAQTLAANGVERHAAAYWRELAECL